MHKLSLLLFVALLTLPSIALAGGCPTCTTSADCASPGAGENFCVEWSRDFGCGTQRIACCPGQACDNFSGRPSCEGADSDGDGVDDCTVVGGATVDAGPTPVDAGPAGADGGSSDGGSLGVDAGGGGADAGSDTTTDGGCGCRAGAPAGSPPLALIGLIALGLITRLRAS